MMGGKKKVQVVKNIQTTAARLNKELHFHFTRCNAQHLERHESQNSKSSKEQMSQPTVIRTWLIYATQCSVSLLHREPLVPELVTAYCKCSHRSRKQAYFLHYEVPVTVTIKIVICLENELLNANNCCMVSIFVIFKEIPFEHTVFSWNMPNFVSNLCAKT